MPILFSVKFLSVTPVKKCSLKDKGTNSKALASVTAMVAFHRH